MLKHEFFLKTLMKIWSQSSCCRLLLPSLRNLSLICMFLFFFLQLLCKCCAPVFGIYSAADCLSSSRASFKNMHVSSTEHSHSLCFCQLKECVSYLCFKTFHNRSEERMVFHMWTRKSPYEGKTRRIPLITCWHTFPHAWNWKSSWSWERRRCPWVFKVIQVLYSDVKWILIRQSYKMPLLR